MATVHVIGAGISGLSAATLLAAQGIPVKLYEATSSAGGRCRSSQDSTLGTIDHGLHLIAGHYRELFAYLERIHARDTLVRLPARYDFADLLSGERWRIAAWKPIPKAPLADLLPLVRLAIAPAGHSLGELMGEENSLYDHWAAPLARGLLHTPAERVDARALRHALRSHGIKKPAQFFMARHSLDATFVTPALTHLDYYGASVYFSHALSGVERDGDRIRSLKFARKKIPLAADDAVIFATPPSFTHSILGVSAPEESHCAITLHYQVLHREPTQTVRFLTNAPADMVRYREGSMHVTIRVAEPHWHSDPELLAGRIWHMLQRLHPYLRHESMPAYAIWREKRAGHVMDRAATSRKPTVIQPLPQCFIAGDWVDPQEPATLESAARSGHEAAIAAKALLPLYPARSQSPFYN